MPKEKLPKREKRNRKEEEEKEEVEDVEIDLIYDDDDDADEIEEIEDGSEPEYNSDIEFLTEVIEEVPKEKKKNGKKREKKEKNGRKSSDEDPTSQTVWRDQRTNKRRKRNPEWDLQTRFVEWMETTKPDVLFCASIAGIWLGKKLGSYCKMAGYRKGFPDMYIYETRGEFCGLFIEFKAPGKRVIRGSEQERKLIQLASRGYCVRVIDSLESAKKTLEWYLTLDKTRDKTISKLNILKKTLREEYSDQDLDVLLECINAIKFDRQKEDCVYL